MDIKPLTQSKCPARCDDTHVIPALGMWRQEDQKAFKVILSI